VKRVNPESEYPSCGAGLDDEALCCALILDRSFLQKLEGDLTIKVVVPRPVDHTHAASAKGAGDGVLGYGLADHDYIDSG